MLKINDFFMPPIKPHRRIMWRDSPHPQNTGLFRADFYGPLLTDEWGWYRAHQLVKNHKEAVAAFEKWVAETKAYIEELGQ